MNTGSTSPPRSFRSLRIVIAVALLAIAIGLLPSFGDALQLPDWMISGEPHREISSSGKGAKISFIDSPTATCFGPMEELDACYIRWSSLSVDASPSQYIVRMTIEINGRMRAFHGGFFQTSMFVPPSMYSDGFKVRCGLAGAGGDPEFGAIYSYRVRATETGGLAASSSGTAMCPADGRLLFSNGFESSP